MRQLWFNTLLGQHVLRTTPDLDEGSVVVVAPADDTPAIEATGSVSSQLLDPTFLAFSSIEDVVASVVGHDSWRDGFRTRYTDLEASA